MKAELSGDSTVNEKPPPVKTEAPGGGKPTEGHNSSTEQTLNQKAGAGNPEQAHCQPEEAEIQPPEVIKVYKSVSTRLIQLTQHLKFFHDDGEPYVYIPLHGHIDVCRLNGEKFRGYLSNLYHHTFDKVAGGYAVTNAIGVLSHRALNGPSNKVYVRVAPYDDGILIDLCDEKRRVVSVTKKGWEILLQSPIPFMRGKNALPLPDPIRGGDLNELWTILNLRPDQRVLFAGLILNALNPIGPFFIANFTGEQGSAKTFHSRILRSLIDPSRVPMSTPAKKEEDLLIQAAHNWCVGQENISYISPEMADAYCRLSTGGAFSKRKLYSDGDEYSWSGRRPLIFNGINDMTRERGDLADRTITLELDPIPDSSRRREEDLFREFNSMHPRLFGLILDALVEALKNKDSITLADGLPRMADATTWITAGEQALGFSHGTFNQVVQNAIRERAECSTQENPICLAIERLVASQNWTGEPCQLFAKLNDIADDDWKKGMGWPKQPNKLIHTLGRLTPELRRIGITIERGKQNGRRVVTIKKIQNQSSQPSGPSRTPREVDLGKPLDDQGTIRDDETNGLSSSINPWNTAFWKFVDDQDGQDDQKHKKKRKYWSGLGATGFVGISISDHQIIPQLDEKEVL